MLNLFSYWMRSTVYLPETVFLFICLLGTVILFFSRLVMPDSLRPHGPQHPRPPHPSLSPGVCSNSCPLNLWCHPTIAYSVVPFSSCTQSFLASGTLFKSFLVLMAVETTCNVISVCFFCFYTWIPKMLLGKWTWSCKLEAPTNLCSLVLATGQFSYLYLFLDSTFFGFSPQFPQTSLVFYFL